MNSSTRRVGRSATWNGVEVESADGSCYVRIEGNDTESGCVLSVGFCCVTIVRDQAIPVSWLAAILTRAKDAGWLEAMGPADEFPADHALMLDPAAVQKLMEREG